MTSPHHYDEQLEALDRRIARLALLCGADLSKQEVVVALIKGNYAACDHSRTVDTKNRDELRALLMMKYKIELSCIDAIGAQDCARLIAEQDDRLRRAGFPPQSLMD